MGTATQVTTFSDLYTDLMNRTQEETSTTATENQAKRYINIALHDMHIGFSESFVWAERRAILVTKDNYTTGTLSVSQGDTTLTGSATCTWDTENAFGVKNMVAGGKIVINGSEEVYEIASVASDTSAELASDFIDSDASSVSYEYFEDEYALASDFGRPVDWQTFADNGEITLIDRSRFRRDYPRNKVTGRPKVATLIDLAPSGSTARRPRVRLHPPPNDFYSIPYTYITTNLAVDGSSYAAKAQLVNDTDEPIVPLKYRHAIVFHALYHWYRDQHDDGRSQEAKAEYTDIMLRIAGSPETGSRRMKIEPRPLLYSYRGQRPYRGYSGRYDLHGRFDRLEDR